jgi:hypothetical protein
MVLSFLQAKAIVCPDRDVIPGSQEHKDIIAMMKQSGRVFADENTVTPRDPLGRVKEAIEMAPFRERKMDTPTPMAVSKKEWLSIEANRKAYQDHLDSQPVYFESPPSYMDLKNKKICGELRQGMSKREFLCLLK